MKKSAFYRLKKFIISTCLIAASFAFPFMTTISTSLAESRIINSKYQSIQVSIMPDTGIPWEELSDKDKSLYYERILLLVFHPYIQKAVNNYYGELRQFDASIVRIKPVGLEHEIQVQVSTFIGPHNPPYGLDNITLLFDGTTAKVIDFKHKDVE